MFEVGRDLRRLFAQAREREDLSWLELIGVDLLAVEARQQCTDAGRVSCAKPHPAWLRGSALWREHARRTGSSESLRKSLEAAVDAARYARNPDEVARAAVEKAQGLLLRFDLSGGRDVLDQAIEAVPGTHACRPATIALISAIHARIKSRLARFEEDTAKGADALLAAAALLDAAIHDMDRTRAGNVDEIRMDRAALALEAGVTRRDAHLLDQAGRELLRLVENASPDYRPLTRSRALTLCGAGLSALGALANDEPAREQGKAMFEAAADQFTPDHSPLDWVVIQIVRGATPGSVSLAALRQADTLTAGQDLLLGAMARDMLIEGEVAAAASVGDVPRLADAETAARRRLAGKPSELDWAVEQIAMARIARARAMLTGSDASATGLALLEAAEVARDHGMPGLAARADALLDFRLDA